MCCLEIGYLDHNGKHLDEIDQSYQDNKQRHLHCISHSGNKTAKCQGTGIPHEHLGRVYIEQKEAHKAAHYRTCDRLNTAAQSQ